MISAHVVGDKKLIQKIAFMPASLRTRILSIVTRLAVRLQGVVKRDKLSGQVLKTRTGTLRRSINYEVIQQPTAIYGIVGTNVEYAAIHEYGFKGKVTVPQHLRLIKQAWGKALKAPKTVSVRQHSRNVNMPERSFLRSALRDMAPMIKRELQQGIQAEIAATLKKP